MTRIDEQEMENIEERKNIDDIPTQLEITKSEHCSTPNGEKHVPKVNSEPDPSLSDSSDSSSSSDSAPKKKKKKKKHRKHRTDDSSDPSLSDDSDSYDSSEDIHYRRRRRKKRNIRKRIRSDYAQL